jgi:hypothetical protein
MRNLEDVKAIIIPTCDYFENPRRARTAIKVVEKYNLPKRCILAGLGPDTNIALGYEKNPGKEELVFHKDMYNIVIDETDWMVGMDIRSLNSIENILEVFPKGTEGKYGLVSYPLHLMRFKKIVKDAKKAGKISKNINIEYFSTRQNLGWIPYEILSNIKYHFIGKKKYFGKKNQIPQIQ